MGVHASAETAGSHPNATFWKLALGSIGVVYGDIGTSPLYAFKESIATWRDATALRARPTSSASSR